MVPWPWRSLAQPRHVRDGQLIAVLHGRPPRHRWRRALRYPMTYGGCPKIGVPLNHPNFIIDFMEFFICAMTSTIHFKRISLGKPTYPHVSRKDHMVFSLDPSEPLPPGLSDPFSMASDFQAKLEEEAERRRRGGAPQGARMAWRANRLKWIPSGYVKIAMENHHDEWENPLFLWSFSIAMLNYQRVHWILFVGYRIYMWTMVDINNHFLNGVTLHWIKLWQLKGTSASVTEMQQRHGEHSPLMVGFGRHFSCSHVARAMDLEAAPFSFHTF